MELTNTYCYLPRFIFIQPSYANQENISKIQTNFSRRLHFYKNENQIQKRYTYKLNGVIVYSQSQNNNGHYWTISLKNNQVAVHNDSRCYIINYEPIILGARLFLYEFEGSDFINN